VKRRAVREMKGLGEQDRMAEEPRVEVERALMQRRSS